MQFRLTAIIAGAALAATILPNQSFAQSGRGRPRVPTREAPAPPPPPARIPAGAALVKQEQIRNTFHFQFKNGITLILNEQHAYPIVAAVATFKAGSSNDPSGAEGTALVLQRAMLAGTDRTTEEFHSRLRSLGAVLSGSTTESSSSFKVLAPATALRQVLEALAQMTSKPSLREVDIERESALPLSSNRAQPALRQSESSSGDDDHPVKASMSGLVSLAMSSVPLSSPSGGRVSREQLLQFHREHYKPERLIITVAGDVSLVNGLLDVQQVFGEFGLQPSPSQAKPAPSAASRPAASTSRTTPSMPAQTPQATSEPRSLRYASRRGSANQTVVSIGFNVPGVDSKDWSAVEVLGSVLGQGRASHLYQTLVDEQGLAYDVGATHHAGQTSGLLAIQLAMSPDSIDRTEAAFFKAIETIRRENITEAALTRAKSVLEKRFLDRIETYEGVADTLSAAEAELGGVRFALDYISRIKAVKAEEVQHAAARYLTLTNTSVFEFESASAAARTFDSERFATTLRSWAPGFDQIAPRAPARPQTTEDPSVVPQGGGRSADEQARMESIEPLPVRDFSTLNGPRAFVRVDHSKPTIAIALLFGGGRNVEDETNPGITALMLRAMLYGTSRRPGPQVALELEQLGAEVEVVAEADFFGFLLSVPSRNAERAIRVLRELTEDPAFREPDLERARRWQIGVIKSELDSKEEAARQTLFKSLFRSHPYGASANGTPESLKALNAEQISAWHNRMVKRQVPIAFVVGDTEGSALVSSQLAEGFRRRELEKSFQIKVPQSKPAEVSIQHQNGLSTTAFGSPGPKAGSEELSVQRILEALMNGPTGRLSKSLSAKSIVGSETELSHEAFFTAGTVYVISNVERGKESQARTVIQSEFAQLAKTDLSPEALQSARLVAETLSQLRLQSNRVRAIEYANRVVFQKDAAEVDNFRERYAGVSAADIKKAASPLSTAAPQT